MLAVCLALACLTRPSACNAFADQARSNPDFQAAYADNALMVKEKQEARWRGITTFFFLVVSDDSGETWTVEVSKRTYDKVEVGDPYGRSSEESLPNRLE